MIGSLALAFGVAAPAQQEDADFVNLMKDTGTTISSLRKNLEAKAGEPAAADAKKLQAIFNKVHDFWEKKKIDAATKFSRDANAGFKEVGEFATAGKFDEAAASLKKTMSTCAGCHKDYREKAPDGSYKIKY